MHRNTDAKDFPIDGENCRLKALLPDGGSICDSGLKLKGAAGGATPDVLENLLNDQRSQIQWFFGPHFSSGTIFLLGNISSQEIALFPYT